jgi:hypothetical protein
MSNSDTLSSKQASPFPRRGLRPSCFSRLQKKGLTRTGGVFMCFPEQGKRSAERRIQFRLPRPMSGAQPRTLSSSPPACGEVGGGPLAFRRSAAVVTAGPRFLGLPGANGRTLPGASAASTSQSGHAPDGTLPKPPARQKRRTPPAGTAPAPSIGVTGDVPHDEQDAALMQSERKPSRIIVLPRSWAHKTGLSSSGGACSVCRNGAQPAMIRRRRIFHPTVMPAPGARITFVRS